MKIAVIQGSSQREKNGLLYACTRRAVEGRHEVVNFGVFPEEAGRKRRDAELLKELGAAVKGDAASWLPRCPAWLLEKARGRRNVAEYIHQYGKGMDLGGQYG